MAKDFLKNDKVEVLDADDFAELVNQYSIKNAPTLVVINGGKVDKYIGLSDIKKYVEQA